MNPTNDIPTSPPALAIGGLRLWIESRHGPASEDYWDGNWLQVIAQCSSAQAQVSVSGPIVHLSEVVALRAGCARMLAGEVTETGLYCMEPNLKVELWLVPGGQVIGKIRITPDHKSELHDFGFALVPGKLAEIVASCQTILERYPVLGKVTGHD